MTKQQPCASKLRISKVCRWLIALGIAKLAFFGAWSLDVPLPQLVFPGGNLASTPAPSAPAAPKADAQSPADASAAASAPVRDTGEVRLAALFAERENSRKAEDSAGRAVPENVPPAGRMPSTSAPDDGAAALRSAALLPSMPVMYQPWSKTNLAETEAIAAANSGERPVASGVDADVAALSAAYATTGNNGWWREIMSLTRLPVPVLGVQQVAHAAAMDTPPPPPMRPSPSGASPFAPPEQAQVRPGQASSEPPLPLRPRQNPLQAGSGISAAQGTGAPAAAGIGAAPAPSSKPFLSPDSPESKQQELARREQDVLMLKQQMESRLQELQYTEKKVQGMLQEAHGVHDQKIKHLISSYTNMKPKQAALAMESLDERLAVRILAGMNPKQAGEVLSYTNPQKVAKLTELLARMQLPGE